MTMDYESSSEFEIDWESFYRNKQFIHVPYDLREEAKYLGAEFDFDMKSWYYTDDLSDNYIQELIRTYGKAVDANTLKKLRSEKTYVNANYVDKEHAKELGCHFDTVNSQWYFTSDINPHNIKQILATYPPLRPSRVSTRDDY